VLKRFNLRRSWDSPELAAVPLPPLSRDTSQFAARRFIALLAAGATKREIAEAITR